MSVSQRFKNAVDARTELMDLLHLLQRFQNKYIVILGVKEVTS